MSATKASSNVLEEPASYLTEDFGNDVLQSHPNPNSISEIETPPPWKAGRQEWLILLCLCIGSLAVSLDATVIAPTLPIIAADLDSTANETFWIGSAYLVTSAVFQLFLAALSDAIGRLHLLMASLVLFTTGSLVACLSHNIKQLLAGRVVQGIGGGGMVVMCLVIISDIVPMRQRAKFIAIPSVAWAIGTIIGPVIGGAFAQHVTWRWSFYLMFPFCGIALVMAPLVIKLRTNRVEVKGLGARLDWTGNFIFIGGVTSFLIGMTWGGTEYAWSSYQTLVPVLVGVFAILMSLVWEARVATQPFIRFSALNKSAIAVHTCGLVQGFLTYAEVYYLAFWLASVKNMSPTRTGVALLPLMLGLIPASVATGFLITKTGKFVPALRTGWALGTLGNGLLILLDSSLPTGAWAVIFIITGLGQGVIINAQSVGAQAVSPPKDAAYAVALYAFSRSVGASLGVALGGTIFQNRLAHSLKVANLPLNIAREAESFLALLKSLPASDDGFRTDVLIAYQKAFRFLFIIMVGISGLGFLLSLVVSHREMDTNVSSDHVLRERAKDKEADEKGITANANEITIESTKE